MAEKRLKFECWNCSRNYTLLRELADKKKLFVACPFCGQEAVVDLTPYLKPIIDIYKTESQTGESEAITLELPEILPTQKLPAQDSDT